MKKNHRKRSYIIAAWSFLRRALQSRGVDTTTFQRKGRPFLANREDRHAVSASCIVTNEIESVGYGVDIFFAC